MLTTITPKQQQANTQSTLAYSRAIQHQQQNQRALSHFLWSHQSDILSGAVNDARVLFFMMNAGAAVRDTMGSIGPLHLGPAAKVTLGITEAAINTDVDTYHTAKNTARCEWNVLKETANNLGTAVKTYHALKGDAANKYLGTSLASGLKFSVQHLLWVVGSTKNETLASKFEAQEIKYHLNEGKNSIRIQEKDRIIHYDLEGASHKGVKTPHKQYSYLNKDPKTGKVYWNKDRQHIEPMTKEDIDILRSYLENKQPVIIKKI